MADKKPFQWEFTSHMTRFSVCILAFIPLCCAAVAQAPVSNAVASPASTPVSGPVSAPVSVQSTATSAASPEIREFQKIEDSWSVAVNDRDQYGLELVLSPLFVDVSASGDISTRNQQVANVITGEDKTVHLDQRVITVRMLGDVAVTNGTYALHHKANTAEVTEKGIFTHVYERSHGSWLCINSQRTVLHEDSNAKQKKQSNAELPFHIPLFSKNDKGPQ
jgi:hypothetical protein